MKIPPEKEKPLPQRKQIRLTGYDYSLPGYYYVTVCTQKRKNILGKIVNGEMKLNKIGRMINQCWQKLPEKFTNVSLDEYIIMPNHLHGIVVINKNGRTHGSAPTFPIHIFYPAVAGQLPHFPSFSISFKGWYFRCVSSAKRSEGWT